MIAKRSDHGVPTVNPLCLTHVESITDGFGHFELVVWIDNQRPRQLDTSKNLFVTGGWGWFGSAEARSVA